MMLFAASQGLCRTIKSWFQMVNVLTIFNLRRLLLTHAERFDFKMEQFLLKRPWETSVGCGEIKQAKIYTLEDKICPKRRKKTRKIKFAHDKHLIFIKYQMFLQESTMICPHK